MPDKESVKKYWAEYFKALQKHEWDRALIALRALREFDPENPQVHLKIGDVLQRTEDFVNAVSSYHQAAQCLINQGFDHKAVAVYKIILKLDSNDRDALDRLRETLMDMESPRTSAIAEENEQPPMPAEIAEEEKVQPPMLAEIESSLFRSLSSEELKALAAESRRLSFGPEETVIKEGDAGDSIFVIIKGKARVSASLSGKTIQLAVLQNGDVFGEVGFLSGRPRTASVSAEGELEVMEIDKPSLTKAIEKNSLILDTLEEFYSSRVQDTIRKVKG